VRLFLSLPLPKRNEIRIFTDNLIFVNALRFKNLKIKIRRAQIFKISRAIVSGGATTVYDDLSENVQ